MKNEYSYWIVDKDGSVSKLILPDNTEVPAIFFNRVAARRYLKKFKEEYGETTLSINQSLALVLPE